MRFVLLIGLLAGAEALVIGAPVVGSQAAAAATAARTTPVNALFGMFNKEGGGGRKADGGMTTSGFMKKNEPEPKPKPRQRKGGKQPVVPDKWLEGRSGPVLNPAWTAWKANN